MGVRSDSRGTTGRHFGVLVTTFKSTEATPRLEQVWDIKPDELSPIGSRSLSLLAADDVLHLSTLAAWQSQTLHEFADLLDLSFPERGRFFNINYFYFEAMNALRESVIAALNGTFHASLAVLRAAFELYVLHVWWKRHRWTIDTYDEFYAWIEGGRPAPSFKKVFEELYAEPVPSVSPDQSSVGELYGRLCSYVHKPKLSESVTSIRGSNDPEQVEELLGHWLGTVIDTQYALVDLSIRTSPQCVYPIDIVGKFGFNAPVGLFFDEGNAIPLRATLGSHFASYSEFFKDAEAPKQQLDWALARPDLSDDEIAATWSEEQPIPRTSDGTIDKDLAWAIVRSKMRALSHFLAYSNSDVSLRSFHLSDE